MDSAPFSPTAGRTIFRCKCHAKRALEYGSKLAAFSQTLEICQRTALLHRDSRAEVNAK
jgi:hypothetical protein